MLKVAQAKACYNNQEMINLNLKAMTTPRRMMPVEQINLLVATTLGYSMVYNDITNTNFSELQVLSLTKNGKGVVEKNSSEQEQTFQCTTASCLVELTRPTGPPQQLLSGLGDGGVSELGMGLPSEQEYDGNHTESQ